MGRRKIEIQPIEDERNRSITFVKRKAGLFKKAHELAILCKVDIAVIILDDNNDDHHEFCSCNINKLLNSYKNRGKVPKNKGLSNLDYNNGGKSDHKRYLSTATTFSATDSIAEDESGSEDIELKHKRGISDISNSTIGGGLAKFNDQIPKYPTNNYPSNNNNINNINNDNDNDNDNNYIKRLKPNNRSRDFPNNPMVGAVNGHSISNQSSISDNYNYVRAQPISYINTNNNPLPQFSPPQTLPFAGTSVNSYHKIPFVSSKLSQYEDSQGNSFNGTNNIMNNNNNNNNNNTNAPIHKPIFSSNFVFPPNQKLPPINTVPPSTSSTNPLPFNSNINDNSKPSSIGSSVNNLRSSPIISTAKSIDNSTGTPGVKEEDKESLSYKQHQSTVSVNSNIPYSAASSPAFTHTPRQISNSSRPVLRVRIPEENDSFKPKKENSEVGGLAGSNESAGVTSAGIKFPPSSRDKDSPNTTSLNGSDNNKSTPVSASLPSALFQFTIPGSITKDKSGEGKNPPRLTTNNLPSTSGLLSSSIRPFLFSSGNGEQTPVSGLPMGTSKFMNEPASKYMNEFFPSPSNYYGEWNESGSSGNTPIRTIGITLPPPPSNTKSSSDSSLSKHSLNNPNGSIRDELPSPVFNNSNGAFRRLKDPEYKKRENSS
ncbi:Smp1 protein [Saccharomycopsis crataegensis]|uniref:Smp1 protein n=1 Tax=Saccharomycopsis crataegensis TaxID=43959 RepID=A0AAV5QPE3_9ASCO|nr:Smp1 protein [Saccharomycopsis crataegensis]